MCKGKGKKVVSVFWKNEGENEEKNVKERRWIKQWAEKVRGGSNI